jgi:hypothetical protein
MMYQLQQKVGLATFCTILLTSTSGHTGFETPYRPLFFCFGRKKIRGLVVKERALGFLQLMLCRYSTSWCLVFPGANVMTNIFGDFDYFLAGKVSDYSGSRR